MSVLLVPLPSLVVHEQVQDHSESSFSDLHAVHIAKTSLMNMTKIGAGKRESVCVHVVINYCSIMCTIYM